MVEDDVIVCDIDGKIIEGDKKPSSDTPAILYIFKNRPEIDLKISQHSISQIIIKNRPSHLLAEAPLHRVLPVLHLPQNPQKIE